MLFNMPKTYVKLTHPNNGYEHDREQVSVLFEDTFYEVEDVTMGQSHTSFRLKNIRGSFNSVQFEFYNADKQPIDIYTMPEYNLYMEPRSFNV